MNNLNSILVEGHLTKDPFEKSIEGTSLSTFSLACNRYYKKDGEHTQETSFFMVDVWGKNAEYCNQYLKKGSGVRVVGRLKQERWKDEEGNNHSTVKIVGEHIDFFPKKKEKDDDSSVSHTHENDEEKVETVSI